ncbi:hypothetical protein LTR86_004568 [Recurvomyces mirabilis]|nr:hypothetical protein LTR86_004568 [Recurvomyces mirabilis]
MTDSSTTNMTTPNDAKQGTDILFPALNTMIPNATPFNAIDNLKFPVDAKFSWCETTYGTQVSGAHNGHYGLEASELKLIRRTLASYVASQLSVQPFVITDDKAAFLVLEEGTKKADRRFLAGGESQYAAIFTVYEGRTKAPEWNEAELKTRHETELRRGIYDRESARMNSDEADRAFLDVQIAKWLEELETLAEG